MTRLRDRLRRSALTTDGIMAIVVVGSWGLVVRQTHCWNHLIAAWCGRLRQYTKRGVTSLWLCIRIRHIQALFVYSPTRQTSAYASPHTCTTTSASPLCSTSSITKTNLPSRWSSGKDGMLAMFIQGRIECKLYPRALHGRDVVNVLSVSHGDRNADRFRPQVLPWFDHRHPISYSCFLASNSYHLTICRYHLTSCCRYLRSDIYHLTSWRRHLSRSQSSSDNLLSSTGELQSLSD